MQTMGYFAASSELAQGLDATAPRASVKYRVQVTTGPHPNHSTTARVFVQLHGVRGHGRRQRLQNDGKKSFQAGSKDVFEITDSDLGRLTCVSLQTDATSSNFEAGFDPSWFVEKCEVLDTKRRETIRFSAGLWLTQDKARGLGTKVDMIPLPGQQSKKAKYRITLFTSSRSGLEASSRPQGKPFIRIFGSLGASPPCPLLSNLHGTLGASAKDMYVVSCPDVGDVRSARIWMQGGDTMGWQLSGISIRDEGSRKEWNARVAQLVPAGGESESLEIALSSGFGRQLSQIVTQKEAPAAPPKQPMAAAPLKDPYRGLQPMQSCEWMIKVQTGKGSKAGTTAAVFVRLHGSHGASSSINLRQYATRSVTTFNAGQTDTFRIPVKFIGTLVKLSVWTDAKSEEEFWRLESITAEPVTEDRASVTFTHGGWVGQHAGVARRVVELTASRSGRLASTSLHPRPRSATQRRAPSRPFSESTIMYSGPAQDGVGSGLTATGGRAHNSADAPRLGIDQTVWYEGGDASGVVQSSSVRPGSARSKTKRHVRLRVKIHFGGVQGHGPWDGDVYVRISGDWGRSEVSSLRKRAATSSRLFVGGQTDEFIVDAVDVGTISGIEMRAKDSQGRQLRVDSVDVSRPREAGLGGGEVYSSPSYAAAVWLSPDWAVVPLVKKGGRPRSAR